jgi:hypothetical protein
MMVVNIHEPISQSAGNRRNSAYRPGNGVMG